MNIVGPTCFSPPAWADQVQIPLKIRKYLYGPPASFAGPGRLEAWTFAHRFTFLRDDANQLRSPQVTTFNFEIGTSADFLWTGLNCQGSAPTILGSGGDQIDTADWFRVGFWSRWGQRAHQSERVLGALIRGDGKTPTGAGAGTMQSFGIPLQFVYPVFIARTDFLRCECENIKNLGSLTPVGVNLTALNVDVSLLGYRWYDA